MCIRNVWFNKLVEILIFKESKCIEKEKINKRIYDFVWILQEKFIIIINCEIIEFEAISDESDVSEFIKI